MRREPPPPQPLPPAEGPAQGPLPPSPPLVPPPSPPLVRGAAPPGATIRGSFCSLGGSHWPVSSRWWAASLLRRLGPLGLLCRRLTRPISLLISRLIWPISSWLCLRAAAHWPSRLALLRSGAAHDDPPTTTTAAAAAAAAATYPSCLWLRLQRWAAPPQWVASPSCLRSVHWTRTLSAAGAGGPAGRAERVAGVGGEPHPSPPCRSTPTSTPTTHLSTPPSPAPSPEPSRPPSPPPSPSPFTLTRNPHPLPPLTQTPGRRTA